MNETAILWFRNDLRLNDHEPLVELLGYQPKHVAFVYCFDTRNFGKTRLAGFPKTGAHRARFLLESLADLRQSLRRLGNDLVILNGRPEEELPKFAERIQAARIAYHSEATDEEIRVERGIEKTLKNTSTALHSYWGSTLFHRGDLPFDVDELPGVFTQFRIRCEKHSKIRPPLATPSKLPAPPDGVETGELPTLADLGLTDPSDDPRAVMRFRGGETAARERVESYLWHDDLLKSYKQTRNGLLGADYSSKFAPWLSLGCISPRAIAAQVAKYEQARVRNDSTYWLVFELMWRDYFRFLALQAGNSLFSLKGTAGITKSWSKDRQVLQRWVEGRTGIPFVDANMRELRATGFMSNRGRQNVASFLAKDLNVDWRFGAEWFESQLIDYDVCSNWGNWAYVAGVGNDPRQDRRFNVVKQAYDYDPNGDYVRTWIPELAHVPDASVHEPWKWFDGDRLPLDFGSDSRGEYPAPMIEIGSTGSGFRSRPGSLRIDGDGNR